MGAEPRRGPEDGHRLRDADSCQFRIARLVIQPTIKNMIKEMKNLTVDPDGYVT